MKCFFLPELMLVLRLIIFYSIFQCLYISSPPGNWPKFLGKCLLTSHFKSHSDSALPLSFSRQKYHSAFRLNVILCVQTLEGFNRWSSIVKFESVYLVRIRPIIMSLIVNTLELAISMFLSHSRWDTNGLNPQGCNRTK